MRRSNTILLLCLLCWGLGHLHAQTLKVELSPDKSKVDRSVSNGTATIFFDSNVNELSIVSTDQNPDEQIQPKSVIRISLCRTAKRNPLIFPI